MPYYITTEELTTLSVCGDMKDNVYVDNVISGCEYEPEVILFFEEARSIIQHHFSHFRLSTSVLCML